VGKSDYSENAVLNYILRGTAMPTVSGLHVALFTVTPSDSGGGTEVAGSSYARVSVARTTGAWSSPSNVGGFQQTSNVAAIVFPTSTGSWGTVVAFGIFDASSGGNLLYWGALSPSRLIAADVAAEFPAGSLVIQEG
jgi:hypothetical protein